MTGAETVQRIEKRTAPLVSPASRRSLRRPIAFLAIASIGLFAFILGLGDVRRQRNALNQALWHAGVFQKRVGGARALPLNLEPEAPPEGATQMIELEWLDRSAVQRLRETGGSIIAAQTVPVLQVLRRDGRAAILFQDGRFEVRWLPLTQFNALLSQQKDRMGLP